MKNIKVFIASSAELDEDKTQFDLYFAQKNKVYSSVILHSNRKRGEIFRVTYLKHSYKIDMTSIYGSATLLFSCFIHGWGSIRCAN